MRLPRQLQDPYRRNGRLYGYAVLGVVTLTWVSAGLVRRRLRHSNGQPDRTSAPAASPADPVAPTDLPARTWRRALNETRKAIGDKDLSMLAAGVAFYGTLAFFPALAALVAIYALFVGPDQVIAAAGTAGHYVPAQMASLLSQQIAPLASRDQSNLWGALIAIAVALFSASGGMQNLIKALNRSYDVEETRSFVTLRAISLILVIGVILFALPIAVLLIVQPAWLQSLGLPGLLANGFGIGRWVLLTILISLALAVFFRYAPNRREPRWQIVSWGGVSATIIWLLGTVAFFLYVQYLANFSKTYGIFAGLVILMSWLYLSSLIILVGAEVNNRLESATEDRL
jgi:membrane protein